MSTSVEPGESVVKDPAARRLYQFDFDALLGVGVTITSYTIVIDQDQLLTYDNDTLAAGSRKVNVRLLGGTLGTTYTVTCTVTTNASPTGVEPRSLLVEISYQ